MLFLFFPVLLSFLDVFIYVLYEISQLVQYIGPAPSLPEQTHIETLFVLISVAYRVSGERAPRGRCLLPFPRRAITEQTGTRIIQHSSAVQQHNQNNRWPYQNTREITQTLKLKRVFILL